MAEYKCPKCGGSDYFMSQRNVVKGMGWAQRGSIKSIPVCRVCDEIMEGAQIGSLSWEDLSRNDGKGRIPFNKISFRTKILLVAQIIVMTIHYVTAGMFYFLYILWIITILGLFFSAYKDRKNFRP